MQANVDVGPDLTYKAEAPVNAACPQAAKSKTMVSTAVGGEEQCQELSVWQSAFLEGQRDRVAVTGQHTCIYRVVELQGVGQAGTGPSVVVKLPIRATLKQGKGEVVWAGVVHTREGGQGTSKSTQGKKRPVALTEAGGGIFTSSKVQKVSVFETIGGRALSNEVQDKVQREWTHREQAHRDGTAKQKVKTEAAGPHAGDTEATAGSKARVGKGKGKGNKEWAIDVDTKEALLGALEEFTGGLSKEVSKEVSKVSAAAKQGSKDEAKALKVLHREEVAALKSELLAAQAVVADRDKQLLVAQNDIAQLQAGKKNCRRGRTAAGYDRYEKCTVS